MTYDPDSSQAKVEDRGERKDLERGDAVTAETFGVAERAVSGRNQIVGRGRVSRQAGDAEAGGDRAVSEGVRRDDPADAPLLRAPWLCAGLDDPAGPGEFTDGCDLARRQSWPRP